MIVNGPQTLTESQREIIKTVLYFDVFKYPLNATELFENSAVSLSVPEFKAHLANLVAQKVLREEEGYYLLPERGSSDILNRLKGNRGAEKVMPVAYAYSRKIASFPFVEGVCLSGGISKNYFDENGDIDFFIITKPDRLWICRTFLILRYKLLPKRLKHFWCTNYFITSANLEIQEKNAFTGTELAFLKPIVNFEAYQNLLKENSWYKLRYPNKPLAEKKACIEPGKQWLKTLFEFMLKGKLGGWLDNFLLHITLEHWRKKYPEMDAVDFELQFRSRKDVCKRHTKGFQNKILSQWQIKKVAFENEFKIDLNNSIP